jgi:ABC-type uncharacterized transport system auxiliary subunit
MRNRQHLALCIQPLVRLAGGRPRLRVLSSVIAALVVLLSGCAKPRPIKYYQITYPSSITVVPEPIDVTLLVRTFEGSHLYLDDRVVYGYDSPEMGTYEDERWAEPPVEMLRDALVRGLRSSGKFKGVYILRSEMSGRYVLSGRLYDFKELDAATISARLGFEARLWDRKTRTLVWTCPYSYDEPADKKAVSAVAAAMDRNVRRSVQIIETNLVEYFKAHPPQP